MYWSDKRRPISTFIIPEGRQPTHLVLYLWMINSTTFDSVFNQKFSSHVNISLENSTFGHIWREIKNIRKELYAGAPPQEIIIEISSTTSFLKIVLKQFSDCNCRTQTHFKFELEFLIKSKFAITTLHQLIYCVSVYLFVFIRSCAVSPRWPVISDNDHLRNRQY